VVREEGVEERAMRTGGRGAEAAEHEVRRDGDAHERQQKTFTAERIANTQPSTCVREVEVVEAVGDVVEVCPNG
jgi:hypothetical protein